MSWISLKLPPARKVWKSFTSTIGKLRRINKSKATKKPRKHTKRSSTTLTSSTKRPYKLPSSRHFSQKKLAGFRSVFYGFHRKPAPIYIDKLFKEPSCDIVKHVKLEMAENPPTRKASKLGDEASEVAGTSNQGGEFDRVRDNKAFSSDDMWESLALASPLMQGINERAEEFIARIKKEMLAQELLARNL
ncbi:hypothetical protein QN277_012804 [Acacia crassicarpa]|uniref:Uncharacterized protein n=1 Tax=Acacia crassicarpa TaxID=499986 RepID=A0AAE1N195_9FABA|nr:hypothetical protein QN277_012804 [Acacia crassicarpa]